MYVFVCVCVVILWELMVMVLILDGIDGSEICLRMDVMMVMMYMVYLFFVVGSIVVNSINFNRIFYLLI